jgi:hypothetical protein
MHPQFATGSNDWLRQNLEPPELLQCLTEGDFFASKVAFVQSANRIVIFSRRKQECTYPEIVRKIKKTKRP